MSSPAPARRRRSESEEVDDDDVAIGNVKVATSALRNVVLFSGMMFTLPLLAYYLMWALSEFMGFESMTSSIIGAVAAVVVVNIIMGAFVLIGWREAVADEQRKKD